MNLDMGMMLHTGDMSYNDIIRLAQEAEELGYHTFCLTEESGKEAFSLLGVLARETKRINLCTSIVNFYSRSPTTLAMAARSIHELSGGRFGPFGLGTGGVGFMERGLAFYCASKHYHPIAEAGGFGEEARKVYDIWQTRDFKGAAAAVSDEFMKKFTLTGDKETATKYLQWMKAEACYPIIYPLPRHENRVEDHFITMRNVAKAANW